MAQVEVLNDLHHAIKRGDVSALRQYLHDDGDTRATDRQGWTPLMMASKQGNTTMIELLVEAGADVNETWDNGFSPLVAAALQGSVRAVKLLLKHGASPHAKYGESLIDALRRYGGERDHVRRVIEAAIADNPSRAV